MTTETNTPRAASTAAVGEPTPRRVLVLGANGRLGAAAVQAFAAAGWRVAAQVRRAPAASRPTVTGVTYVQAPLDATDVLVREAQGATVVVYAINPLYTRWRQEALPMLQLGIGVAERLGARLMLPGNVYNYGDAMPARVHEDAPQRPHTEHGRIRVAMEAALAQRCARGRLAATVLTAGDFFGVGTGTWFDQVIIKSIARGKLVYPGPTDVMHSWAYLPDLAQAFVALASAPAQDRFERFHFRGHALTGAELLDAVERAARTLGAAPAGGFKRGGMPWGLVRAIGVVLPMWRALATMSYLWRVPHELDDTRLAARIGTPPLTSLDVALRATLASQMAGHDVAAPLVNAGT